ncbi:hypothetical protein ACFY7C_16100 [Streptomyces sp. NPDC012769]|uniref:hypothetical protein n=1 Tax=Streptomyces sp. NPDC012769 TaxID=3364848 RepID=UPI0036ADEE91
MMSGPTKTMGVITFAALVLITTYTVALGSSGWLWFAWIVLGVATVGMAAADSGETRAGPVRRHRPKPQP